MTNREKFAKGIVVFKDETGNYICELQGASTKHPDSRYRFNDWKDKIEEVDPQYQIFQWLLFIASRMNFAFHAKEIAEYALAEWA